jgi:hypothetical protein
MTVSDDITAAIATLTAYVANTDGVVASAIVAFHGIVTQMTLLANNPAAIIALASQLNASATTLAAAISATPIPTSLTDAAGVVLTDDSGVALLAG